MVEKLVLNNKGRGTGQREIRPVWNNAQSVNHQNKLTHPHPKRNFVPTTVATKSGQVPVNDAKKISPRATSSISTARPVNTAAHKPKVNDALPTTYSYFKAHSPRPTKNVIDHNFKDSGSYMLKRFYYVDLQGRLNGCSRHMTGNKSFLKDYQEIDGGFVAFRESPKGGQITGKRTMLADSLLPTTFWAEVVSTACYVQNWVLVTKPHKKTPDELLHGRPPSISFMRPFGCHVTILNTLDTLCKFDGNDDEGFFVGYSINRTGPDWLFDIDLLTNSMNYEPATAGNQTNRNACIKDNSSEDAVADDAGKKTNEKPANKGERNGQEKEGGASNKEDDQNVQDFRAELDNLLVQQKEGYANNTNKVSIVSPSVSAAGQSFNNANLLTDPLMPSLEDTADLLNTGIFSGAYDDEDEGAEDDLNNLETIMNVSPIPTTRIHKDHPKDHIIRDINSATQTRRMTKISEEHAM
ncbi:ribonuclease H-like domain-containing protein, partial [Tanacetum coccineum]